jgi:ATP-dependent Zn protease
VTVTEASVNADAAMHLDADAVLRRLARRALGCSGADIERLVREARQRARRKGRPLTYADLNRLLSASRPVISPEKRRRMAVHEAGHALARILLDLGELKVVTIDAADGGFTEAGSTEGLIDTAERFMDYLVVTMAGRAAERVAYGSVLAGSGGSSHSDLARATQVATLMETSLGYGHHQPLLYRDPGHWQALLWQNARLARRVHRRLARAETSARKLIRRHRFLLHLIADALEARGTLEGPELATLVERVRAATG